MKLSLCCEEHHPNSPSRPPHTVCCSYLHQGLSLSTSGQQLVFVWVGGGGIRVQLLTFLICQSWFLLHPNSLHPGCTECARTRYREQHKGSDERAEQYDLKSAAQTQWHNYHNDSNIFLNPLENDIFCVVLACFKPSMATLLGTGNLTINSQQRSVSGVLMDCII